uniref:Uncharacterized protein n=1 Tax=Steinernema glaseri TaxID=37863 RepID=A0A1I7ZBS7_9BILA
MDSFLQWTQPRIGCYFFLLQKEYFAQDARLIDQKTPKVTPGPLSPPAAPSDLPSTGREPLEPLNFRHPLRRALRTLRHRRSPQDKVPSTSSPSDTPKPSLIVNLNGS